ncbi:MAG: hypothetical protein C4336_06475 [Armatimonadota bacterium]
MGLKLFSWRRRKSEHEAEGTPTHLLVPFTNTPEECDLLRYAVRMAQIFDAHLTVLCFVEVSRGVDLSCCPAEKIQRGEVYALAAREIIEELGFNEFTIQIRPTHHCGFAIVNAVQEYGCDMVCITAAYRQLLGRQLLTETVETVLRKVPVQVCLYSKPKEAKR